MSKVFVLRTHALLSSRTSTLKFGDDNEIVIPIGVLEELKNDINQRDKEENEILTDRKRH